MLLHLFILINVSCCVQALISTTTEVKCATRMGKSPLSSIKTTTKTITEILLPVIIRITSTPTITVTPHATSTTLTATVTSTTTTTAPTITDVFSTTLTSTLSSTATQTVTSTAVTTITTTTSTTFTSAVPTSPGFRPVADTTASVYPAKKRAINHIRDSSNIFAVAQRSVQKGCVGGYPIAVFCKFPSQFELP